MLELEQYLGKARDSRSGLQMTNVRLHRTDRTELAIPRSLLKCFGEPVYFHLIAQRRAGCSSLNVADRTRIDSRFCKTFGYELRLCVWIWGVSIRLSVVI